MLHFETIEPATLGLLKSLQAVPELIGTRLVGGTALALQLGHRKSIDIDLFGKIDCESMDLLYSLKQLGNVAVEKDTPSIHLYIINNIKVDIINYKYEWLKECVCEDSLKIASIEDIAAMKIMAIIGRGKKKDFIDLAKLLEFFSLDEILKFYVEKYPDGSLFMARKSLPYFVDAENDPMPEMFTNQTWDEVKNFILSKIGKCSF